VIFVVVIFVALIFHDETTRDHWFRDDVVNMLRNATLGLCQLRSDEVVVLFRKATMLRAVTMGLCRFRNGVVAMFWDAMTGGARWFLNDAVVMMFCNSTTGAPRWFRDGVVVMYESSSIFSTSGPCRSGPFKIGCDPFEVSDTKNLQVSRSRGGTVPLARVIQGATKRL
jgi:hypothetical protein